MNEVLYLVACVMMLREPTVWRWSHSRHHTDTLIVGRDPEISNPRPTNFFKLFLDFFAVRTTAATLYKLVVHSCGRLTAVDRCLIPAGEHPRVVWEARLGFLLLASVFGACVAVGSILPALFVGLPSMYGSAFGVFVATTQHAGLAEDVLDHRLNSRTVYMNVVFRFLYWNMNYHLEHHLFPMVPFHALPRLHAVVKPYLPAPYAGCLAAYREIIPTLMRQQKDTMYFIRRPLPQSRSVESDQRPAAALDHPVALEA